MDDKNFGDELSHEDDLSTLPTKEWLRRKRKAEYEKAKAAAKETRQAEKAAAAEQRAREQQEKDAALWQALRKGDHAESPED